MAKYSAVDETTKQIFMDAIEKAGLTQHVKFDIVNDSKQKQIHKFSSKANPYVEYKSGIEVVVYINEDIFWQLEDEQQVMVAEEAIGGAVYNSERDVITIEKPDVVTFSGIIRKYGADNHERLRESIKSLYDKKENDGEEAGEAKTVEA